MRAFALRDGTGPGVPVLKYSVGPALKEKKVNADTEIICVGFDYRMDVLH